MHDKRVVVDIVVLLFPLSRLSLNMILQMYMIIFTSFTSYSAYRPLVVKNKTCIEFTRKSRSSIRSARQ